MNQIPVYNYLINTAEHMKNQLRRLAEDNSDHAHGQRITQAQIELEEFQSELATIIAQLHPPTLPPSPPQPLIQRLSAEGKSVAFIEGYLSTKNPPPFNRFLAGSWQWRDYNKGLLAGLREWECSPANSCLCCEEAEATRKSAYILNDEMQGLWVCDSCEKSAESYANDDSNWPAEEPNGTH